MCFEKNSSNLRSHQLSTTACLLSDFWWLKSNEIFGCDARRHASYLAPNFWEGARWPIQTQKSKSFVFSLLAAFLPCINKQQKSNNQTTLTYHKLTNNIFWPFVPPASNLHQCRDTCDENKLNRTTTTWWDEDFLCQECFSLCCSASYLAAARSVPQKEVLLHQSRRTRIRTGSELERHGVCLLWLFQKTMRINPLWNW